MGYSSFLQCTDRISGQQNRPVCRSYDHDRSRKAFSKLLECSISRNQRKTKWSIFSDFTFPYSKYAAKLSAVNAFSIVCCRYFSHTTEGDWEGQWECTRKAELHYLLNCLNQWRKQKCKCVKLGKKTIGIILLWYLYDPIKR